MYYKEINESIPHPDKQRKKRRFYALKKDLVLEEKQI